MLKQLVVLCAVVGFTTAAMALGKPAPKPEKFKDVEGCYMEDLDAVIPIGESRPAKTSCMEYRCGAEYVQYVSCGIVVVTPPEELVEHRDRPYPYCCPTVKGHDDWPGDKNTDEN